MNTIHIFCEKQQLKKLESIHSQSCNSKSRHSVKCVHFVEKVNFSNDH